MSQIPREHADRYCYHFTHIDNLPSIIENGLLCTNKKNEQGIEHFNVASHGIQQRRSTMEVTCEPHGVVHDYVPFYLCSVNPMFLQMVNTKNVDQQDIVVLAIPLKKIEDVGSVFTDASANTNEPPNFYTDPGDLTKLNWPEIDSQKWKSASPHERQQKMAEVLFLEQVEISDIEYLIIWNDNTKIRVQKIFTEKTITPPKFSYREFRKGHFFYVKFKIKGHDNESLVTGPRILREMFEHIVETLISEKKKKSNTKFLFKNITDALVNIRSNFSCIKELAGIYELETLNDVHDENVSDHTLLVVENVKKTNFYKSADEEDQTILELSAYLHDIGKGPAAKWENRKQLVYPDHPADGAEMIERILREDIDQVSDYQIRMICLLVIYHDLIGDILSKGRNRQQLLDVIHYKYDVEMLSALNSADVKAINWVWSGEYSAKIKEFKIEILKEKGIE